MMAVSPVFVARMNGRWNSRTRILEICRCWSIATVSPNHAMLLTFMKIVGAVSGSVESLAKLFTEEVFIADVGRETLSLPRKGVAVPAHHGGSRPGDVHHLGEPPEEGRDELAERDQMVLVVSVAHPAAIWPAVPVMATTEFV
jgi:hypothetical protein